jgi:hypothetical protein
MIVFFTEFLFCFSNSFYCKTNIVNRGAPCSIERKRETERDSEIEREREREREREQRPEQRKKRPVTHSITLRQTLTLFDSKRNNNGQFGVRKTFRRFDV